MPLISEGFDATKLAKSLKPRYPASLLDWPNTVLSANSTNNAALDTFITSQLGDQLVSSKVKSATLKNTGSTGIDISYGSLSNTRWDPLTFEEHAFIRFGPVAIPKRIEFQMFTKFWANTIETFSICAITDKKAYLLLEAYQPNLASPWSSKGIRTNNGFTLLKAWSNVTTAQYHTGDVDVSKMDRCFTEGEDHCEIFITRLAYAWPPSKASLVGASQLVLQSLKIT